MALSSATLLRAALSSAALCGHNFRTPHNTAHTAFFPLCPFIFIIVYRIYLEYILHIYIYHIIYISTPYIYIYIFNFARNRSFISFILFRGLAYAINLLIEPLKQACYASCCIYYPQERYRIQVLLANVSFEGSNERTLLY